MIILDDFEGPAARLSCRCGKPIEKIDNWKKRIVNRGTKVHTGRVKGLIRYTHPDRSACWYRLKAPVPSLN